MLGWWSLFEKLQWTPLKDLRFLESQRMWKRFCGAGWIGKKWHSIVPDEQVAPRPLESSWMVHGQRPSRAAVYRCEKPTFAFLGFPHTFWPLLTLLDVYPCALRAKDRYKLHQHILEHSACDSLNQKSGVWAFCSLSRLLEGFLLFGMYEFYENMLGCASLIQSCLIWGTLTL